MPGHVGTIARVKRGVCSDDETTEFSGSVQVAQGGKGGDSYGSRLALDSRHCLWKPAALHVGKDAARTRATRIYKPLPTNRRWNKRPIRK
jgi:hypothetical protein